MDTATTREQLLAELKLMRQMRETSGEFPDEIRAAYARSESILQNFVDFARRLETNPELTEVGRTTRRRTAAESLVLLAEQFTREAADVEDQLDGDFQRVLAEEMQGPEPNSIASFVDALRQRDIQQKLEAEDVLHRHLIIRMAAERGAPSDREIVRAALTAPTNGLTLATPPGQLAPKWQPLADTATVEAVHGFIRARRSPQGPAAWRAQELRGIATRLQHAAGVSDGALERIAAGAQAAGPAE